MGFGLVLKVVSVQVESVMLDVIFEAGLFMTILAALAILEAAVLESKKRNVNTPEVKEALDLLERYVWPKWLIPQFRHSRE